ncbi:tRNA pseudouridine synthase B [Schinkia azotoformans MEV2011]|uniref:tRNA pseudouridine synthase B n=1 Tax=Schinkia azotoformans MEV2011 TaxID=1348973 RepID=A0A072NQZ5_SCHAZ|nr:tRNA pseudouridine(55) synthase TruB [Schinkia azotoformans]KEF39921.1 tRNA pseudouridine synthase B [Schinkia azotoformans MEV2011]MEC1697220.1 tRNA pseudouridine(55) synthase TruB [Schinkia azotoformans]MEC1715247.1 tRNA pseudouridine(55) synthase TruB [Schinkia azotoformans]MEC1724259.1 tRNA pseudouridine(55) synthase TruB [Schinkia azotoformans]MEC1741002.1 tRNA pseudouridine(55) synthase TruB [Schinkia azotoformans]
MEGILPLWKPRGMTSHDCVFKIRKLLKTKKVGHTGTLDPDVDGVLPICVGRATKVAEYLTESQKAYEGEVTIGTATTTEDASGEVVLEKTIIGQITIEELKEVLHGFHGEITQVPPMFSAVKVNGKRLYEFARQGIEVERPERTITIYEFKLLDSFDFLDHNNNSFRFFVKASKGTYVRTLAVDIGKALGYPAHMSNLTRVASGSFTSEDCLTFEEIQERLEKGELELFPLERAISHLTKLKINEKLEMQVKNGQVLSIPEGYENEKRFVLLNNNNDCVAIYIPHPTKQGLMKPEKVIRNT